VSVRFLLDINALSEPLRRDPHRGFMRRLRITMVGAQGPPKTP
jgi:hypothetical protein